MKLESTIIRLKINNSPNNEQNQVKHLQNRQKQFYLRIRLWRIFFWDSKRIIFIDYPEKGKAYNDVYYNVYYNVWVTKWRKNYSIWQRKESCFTIRMHLLIGQLLRRLKSTNWISNCPSLPPYSLDLAPSEFHLFSNLKKWLEGKRFVSHWCCQWVFWGTWQITL